MKFLQESNQLIKPREQISCQINITCLKVVVRSIQVYLCYIQKSRREEVEQDVINNSVEVNIKNKVNVASLPFMQNPAIKLVPNKNKALQINNQQIRKLDQNLQDKRDTIESEAKLQKLGFVEFVKNLTPEQQKMLKASDVQNFIPWRAVWNGNSVSTPCRINFDASQQTPTGTSLKYILPREKQHEYTGGDCDTLVKT